MSISAPKNEKFTSKETSRKDYEGLIMSLKSISKNSQMVSITSHYVFSRSFISLCCVYGNVICQHLHLAQMNATEKESP